MKSGAQRVIQKYKCNNCKHRFSSNRRPKKFLELLFYKYVFKHQTYADLAIEYGKTKRWIYTHIHSYELAKKEHNPRAVTLVCDTTFMAKEEIG
ncbi:hypothetical protein [Francisella opportunistica]|uniref:hypothetical protein n=1 Tax=Francisella TaxID=262 RepID=UPI003B845483